MKSFLFLLALGLILGGGQALYTNVTNLKPVEISIADLTENGTDDKWLTVTDASLDVVGATYMAPFYAADNTANELFIPLRVQDEEEKPLRIFLHTKDPKMLEVYNGLLALEEEVEMINYLVKHREVFSQVRNVTGLVRFGLESDSDERKLLEENNRNLADGFLILEEGTKPEWSMVVMLPLGLLLLWSLVFKKRASSTATPPPPPAPSA